MVLISTVTLGSSGNITIPIKYKTMFNSIIVPPIRRSITGADTTISLEVTIPKKATSRYTNAYVSNGNGLSILLHREDFLGSEERKSFSFVYDEFHGTDVFFFFEIIEDKIVTKTATITPAFITYERHEISESGAIITSSPAKSYFLGAVKDQDEKFEFIGFDGILGRTTGCFDLSTYKLQSFLATKKYDPRLFKCGVFIADDNSYFSDVGKTVLRVTEIPLKLIREETGVFHLELENTIYINPENLLMSNSYHLGWIPTKRYIYLPKNCKETIKNSEMLFYFDSLGINSIYVSHTFSLNGINNDFGYCQNSKYCVEVETPMFSDSRG